MLGLCVNCLVTVDINYHVMSFLFATLWYGKELEIVKSNNPIKARRSQRVESFRPICICVPVLILLSLILLSVYVYYI